MIALVLALVFTSYGLGIVMLAASRGPADTTGKRAFTIYATVAAAFSLAIMLVALFTGVSKLTALIPKEGDSYGVSPTDIFTDPTFDTSSLGSSSDYYDSGDVEAPSRTTQAIGGALEALIIALVAGAIFGIHFRLLKRIRKDPSHEGSAAQRIDRAYLFVVCAGAILAVLLALATGLFDVLKIAVPDLARGYTSKSAQRRLGIASLLNAIWGTLLAGWAFTKHWREASPKPSLTGIVPAPIAGLLAERVPEATPAPEISSSVNAPEAQDPTPEQTASDQD